MNLIGRLFTSCRRGIWTVTQIQQIQKCGKVNSAQFTQSVQLLYNSGILLGRLRLMLDKKKKEFSEWLFIHCFQIDLECSRTAEEEDVKMSSCNERDSWLLSILIKCLTQFDVISGLVLFTWWKGTWAQTFLSHGCQAEVECFSLLVYFCSKAWKTLVLVSGGLPL